MVVKTPNQALQRTRPKRRAAERGRSAAEAQRVAKAQIIVAVDQPDEVRAVAAWFDRWRSRLAAVSENTGCGCCVDIWDVDGPAEVLAELPAVVVAHPGVQS